MNVDFCSLSLYRNPKKLETWIWCWNDAGSASQTLARHQSSIESTSRVCRSSATFSIYPGIYAMYRGRVRDPDRHRHVSVHPNPRFLEVDFWKPQSLLIRSPHQAKRFQPIGGRPPVTCFVDLAPDRVIQSRADHFMLITLCAEERMPGLRNLRGGQK